MTYRIGGQVVDQGSGVADQPVFVVDTGDADPTNWTVEAATTTAADGSWSVVVSSGDLERYHAVTQFEGGSTLKNAESKPFVTGQPVVRPVEIPIQFEIPSPAISAGSAIPDSVIEDFESGDISNYGGDNSAFTVQTTTVFEQNYALELDNVNYFLQSISTDENLSGAFPVGHKADCRVRIDSDTANNELIRTGILFGASTSGTAFGLGIDDNDDKVLIFDVNVGGSGYNPLSSSALTNSIPYDDWLRFEIEWYTNGDINGVVKDSAGTEIGSVSTNDTRLQDNDGVGFSVSSSGDVRRKVQFDYYYNVESL